MTPQITEYNDAFLSGAKIDLFPSQIDHYARMKQIYGYSHCMIDTSPMGSGKSITALLYALEHGLRPFICCQLSLKEKFLRFAHKFGLDPIIMTYNKLRGNSRGNSELCCSHDYLVYQNGKYLPTNTLVSLIQSGILVIFDEFQALKNDSCQHHAALAVARTVACYRGNSQTRVLYLSETPITDTGSIGNVVRLLCLTNCDNLIENEPNKGGYYDVVNIAKTINPDFTKYVPPEPTSKIAVDTIYSLYTQLLKYYYSSSMPELTLTANRDIKSCFYNVPDDQADIIAIRIGKLREAIEYNSDGSAKFKRRVNNNDVLQLIELAKVPLFIRITTETLTNVPNSKVILSLNYLKTVSEVAAGLSSFNPLVITGKTNEVTRNSSIDSFQNDSSSRLMIISRVGREGIDLDDQVGNHPRYMYISPSYSFVEVYQVTGRVYRSNTKSDVVIRLVYAYNPNYQHTMAQEGRVLRALGRKEKVTRQFTTIDRTDNSFSDCQAVLEDNTPFNIDDILVDCKTIDFSKHTTLIENNNVNIPIIITN